VINQVLKISLMIRPKSALTAMTWMTLRLK
jgi:hypothetical protein